MVNEIGETAGEVWSALAEESRPMTVSQLTKKTGLSVDRLCMAIGWLAREDKLQFSGTKAIIEISLK
jgi:DNA-binding transcriptional regulator GbsR (MarR family)